MTISRKEGVSERGIIKTFTVASGQTVYLGRGVYISATGEVSAAGASREGVVGVITDVPFRGECTQYPDGTYIDAGTATAGDEVSVMLSGLVVVLTSGSNSIGAFARTDTDSKFTTQAVSTVANYVDTCGKFVDTDNTNNKALLLVGGQ